MRVDDLLALVRVAEERAKVGKPRDLALLLFLADTGCRVGELVSVRVEGLDLERCEALVSGKTGARVVDFTERTRAALEVWLDVGRVVDGVVFVRRRRVCEAGRCGALTPMGVYQVLKRLAKRAGVKKFNPHAIRHLVGQSWADQVNLELVRQKLGHRDIHTTAMFYANQDRARVRAATRRLSLVNGVSGEKID